MSNNEPQPDPPHATRELFEKAVALHSRRLLAIARAIVGPSGAEDVVQQALTNLYQHRRRYDWRDPAGLLRRTVVNESLRVLRHPRMAGVPDNQPGGTQSPAASVMDRETVEQVRLAIAQLPEHFRAALVLCEYEGMSYAEIAEVLDISVAQVKTWLHRGRRQLARRLAGFMGVEGEGSSSSPPGPAVGEPDGRD